MTKICKAVILSTLAFTLAGPAFAQAHPDNSHYVQHNEWKKGARINHDDWNRGDQVDYRSAHLHAPPRGYEWRRVDGNYVEAAVATGVIASVIVAASVH